MIDNICGFEMMSFMDGFSGYNQIKMYPRKAYFISDTVRGIVLYCYAFGLKNAGVTYQSAMSTIFHNHLQKMVECYVDDIAIKSRDKNDHFVT